MDKNLSRHFSEKEKNTNMKGAKDVQYHLTRKLQLKPHLNTGAMAIT